MNHIGRPGDTAQGEFPTDGNFNAPQPPHSQSKNGAAYRALLELMTPSASRCQPVNVPCTTFAA